MDIGRGLRPRDRGRPDRHRWGVTVRSALTCVFVLVCAVLILAPAPALAATGVGAKRPAPSGPDLQRLSDTTYLISGHVLDYTGSPVARAEVDWGW